jgi:hypothetical protein
MPGAQQGGIKSPRSLSPSAVSRSLFALAVFPITLAVLELAASGCYHLARRRAESTAPRVYAERCSTCHGASGRGDGLAGRSLDPRPRDFANPAWQESISDERIRLTIREGGRAAGRSPLMPAHPDLSVRDLQLLVAYIRQVGARAGETATSPVHPGSVR